jgi:hypothetical protein
MNEAFGRTQNSSKRQRKLYITPSECTKTYWMRDNMLVIYLNNNLMSIEGFLERGYEYIHTS